MLEQFLFGLTVVVPIFLLLGLGGIVRQQKIMSADGFRQLNRLVYHVLLPSNVFYSISQADRSRLFEGSFSLLIFFGMLIVLILGMIIVPKLVASPRQQGVIVQSLIRGNFVIMGFPILTRLYGQHGLDMVGLVLLISMPMYNISSVLALEGLQGNHPSFGKMIRKIIQNPMIISTILGIIGMFLPLPSLLLTPLQMVADASGTIALITLGGLLELTNLRHNRNKVLAVSALRLIIIPLIVLTIGYLLGMNEISLMTLMVFFAAPVAVVSFAMVERLGGDQTLAGQLILVSTIASLASYVFWIGAIRSLFN